MLPKNERCKNFIFMLKIDFIGEFQVMSINKKCWKEQKKDFFSIAKNFEILKVQLLPGFTIKIRSKKEQCSLAVDRGKSV